MAAFVRQLNDEMGEGAYGEWNPHGDALRAKYLSDLFPMLVGTRSTPEVELKRAYIFADGAVRGLAATVLEESELSGAAFTLRALPPIINQDTAQAAYTAARDASEEDEEDEDDWDDPDEATLEARGAALAASRAARNAARANDGRAARDAANVVGLAAAASPHRRDDPETGPAYAWVEARALFIRAMEVSDE